MLAIEVEGLEKTYPKGVKALDGLSFSAQEGEVFGLLGPNGAGKSTTVKILVTLSTPDAGRATRRSTRPPRSHAIPRMITVWTMERSSTSSACRSRSSQRR